MDPFSDEVPSTSLCISPNGYEMTQMTEDTDQVSGEFLNMKMLEIQEHPTSPALSVEEIRKRVQELVEETNDRRASDQKVLEAIQEEIMEKVSEVCQQMKEKLYLVYEDNSNKMQVKLQELTEVLERCSKLHQDLLEASQALRGLRESLVITDMPANGF